MAVDSTSCSSWERSFAIERKEEGIQSDKKEEEEEEEVK